MFKFTYQWSINKLWSPHLNSVLSNSQVHHHCAMLPLKKVDGNCDYYGISSRAGSLGYNTLGAHFQVLYSSLSWVMFSLLYFKRSGQASFKQHFWTSFWWHLPFVSTGLEIYGEVECLEILRRGWVVRNFVIFIAIKLFFKNDKAPWEQNYMTWKLVAMFRSKIFSYFLSLKFFKIKWFKHF